MLFVIGRVEQYPKDTRKFSHRVTTRKKNYLWDQKERESLKTQ